MAKVPLPLATAIAVSVSCVFVHAVSGDQRIYHKMLLQQKSSMKNSMSVVRKTNVRPPCKILCKNQGQLLWFPYQRWHETANEMHRMAPSLCIPWKVSSESSWQFRRKSTLWHTYILTDSDINKSPRLPTPKKVAESYNKTCDKHTKN